MRNPEVFGQRFFRHGGFGIFLEVFLRAIFMEKGKQGFGPRADVPALQERRWHLAVEGLPKLNVPSGRLPFRLFFNINLAPIFLFTLPPHSADGNSFTHRTPISTLRSENAGERQALILVSSGISATTTPAGRAIGAAPQAVAITIPKSGIKFGRGPILSRLKLPRTSPFVPLLHLIPMIQGRLRGFGSLIRLKKFVLTDGLRTAPSDQFIGFLVYFNRFEAPFFRLLNNSPLVRSNRLLQLSDPFRSLFRIRTKEGFSP